MPPPPPPPRSSAQTALISAEVMAPPRRRAARFTAEEDSVLLTAVRERNTKWEAIKGLADSGEQYAALARFGAGQLCTRFQNL